MRNLKDVRWRATEDGSVGPGTGRHVACFVLKPENMPVKVKNQQLELFEP